MKHIYKFTTWLLLEVLTLWTGFNCGILWFDKKLKEKTVVNSEPVITKTDKPRSDRYKRTKVGFQYDEVES